MTIDLTFGAASTGNHASSGTTTAGASSVDENPLYNDYLKRMDRILGGCNFHPLFTQEMKREAANTREWCNHFLNISGTQRDTEEKLRHYFASSLEKGEKERSFYFTAGDLNRHFKQKSEAFFPFTIPITKDDLRTSTEDRLAKAGNHAHDHNEKTREGFVELLTFGFSHVSGVAGGHKLEAILDIISGMHESNIPLNQKEGWKKRTVESLLNFSINAAISHYLRGGKYTLLVLSESYLIGVGIHKFAEKVQKNHSKIKEKLEKLPKDSIILQSMVISPFEEEHREQQAFLSLLEFTAKTVDEAIAIMREATKEFSENL